MFLSSASNLLYSLSVVPLHFLCIQLKQVMQKTAFWLSFTLFLQIPDGFLNFGTDLDLGPQLELEMDLIFAVFTAFTITL